MQKSFSINYDVFSNGQVDSKLWLCRELESLNLKQSRIIWLLGGWCGITAFLLLSREQLPIKHIRSFDIDPNCESLADAINENWVSKEWKFKAFTKDANLLKYDIDEKPDIVINTSCEHFDSMEWFDNIPRGTLVILQSNNLKHDEDTNMIESIDQMILKYPLINVIYSGNLDFNYDNNAFSRYMIIGFK